MPHHRPIAYPEIEHLGVIGDRRSAALVAADSTLNWLCLPDYDGDIIFGALLDHRHGGFWTLGPARRWLGKQHYVPQTASLVTVWDDGVNRLELTDLMAWPEEDRPKERQERHVVIRRLRCTQGRMACFHQAHPACNYKPASAQAMAGGSVAFACGSRHISFWCNRATQVNADGAQSSFELSAGEEVWAALEYGAKDHTWTLQEIKKAVQETETYWKQWASKLNYRGPRRKQVERSALCVHLLSYAPCGSVVAAPTTSLPERIGGDWNADYRLAWVRDASLSLMVLTQLGAKQDTERYLDWLCGLDSRTDSPLQVVYGIRGEKKLTQQENKDLAGYRHSKPVRFGNHAANQVQHDALGFLLDCIKIYLDEGGQWKPKWWKLVCRAADHLAKVWKKPGNSIWELSEKKYFVSDQVMCWLGLERALHLAQRLGETGNTDDWRKARDAVHAEVLERGWSDKLKAFRQHYDGDNLDSSVLLIPIMGFLPPDDPRVRSTVERIAERLTIGDMVYRFDPEESPGVPQPPLPLGEFEGAFVPCTCWMASAYALIGETDRAEQILRRIDEISPADGLLAEAIDGRSGSYRGNHPLLFSQVEYVRAVRTLEQALPSKKPH